MSSLYTQSSQHLYLVSEPVCSGVLTAVMFLSPVFLTPKQHQRQLGQNENKVQDCMAGVSAWIYSVAASRRMQTQVRKCCKTQV